MYDKQLMTKVFVSEALQSNVDEARFNRSTSISPRKCFCFVVLLVTDFIDCAGISCLRLSTVRRWDGFPLAVVVAVGHGVACFYLGSSLFCEE